MAVEQICPHLRQQQQGCPTPITPEELERRAIIQRNDLVLHEAVIKNDTEGVRRVLKEPIDINCRNNYGRSPLHWASSRGNLDIMEMLIACHCDVEARDKYGMRPLLMAAWHGHKDAVQLLINTGACVNATNKKQYTLLICAAKNNRIDVIDFLLENLEDVNLDAVDNEGQSALFHAAMEGHLNVVRKLVENGATLDTRNKISVNPQRNARHYYLDFPRESTVRCFSSRISKVKDSKTALHLSSERGHDSVVDYLLRHEAEIEARDLAGNTPLHLAAQQQQTRVVQILLENGADANPENSKGCTPLHTACSLGTRCILEALLHHGALLNKQNKIGNTPMHMACQSNVAITVETLIARGADLNCLNERRQSPIHIAAEMGHTEICKLLLSAGANIEQREQGGRTPLYIAARGSFTAIVDMIIKTARLDYPQQEEPENGKKDSVIQIKPVLNTARRKWKNPETNKDIKEEMVGKYRESERLREVLYKLCYKQLGPGEWKRLAQYWAFTEEQIRAIEHQYTGPSSYKEHGFRMTLIWAHGLTSDVNPIKELYESLTAIDKKNVADALRRKLDQDNEDRRKGRKKICTSCNIT